MNKMYHFPVVLVGYGEDPDSAWDDACEGFEENHGPTPDDWSIEAEEVEE